jgi:hypothetical protein
MGKIDDFTIKPIKQHSYLLSGFSRHTSPLITAEAGRDRVDLKRTRSQEGKAVDYLPFMSRSEPASSDDDESGLSDSDPEVGSDDEAIRLNGPSTLAHLSRRGGIGPVGCDVRHSHVLRQVSWW